MKTIARDSTIPAVPTIHVSRRKRITPRMFCMQGRKTPINVPIWGPFKQIDTQNENFSYVGQTWDGSKMSAEVVNSMRVWESVNHLGASQFGNSHLRWPSESHPHSQPPRARRPPGLCWCSWPVCWGEMTPSVCCPSHPVMEEPNDLIHKALHWNLETLYK